MVFDSPATVYDRALPAGFRFDPLDEQSVRNHYAALEEVRRVHPVSSWPNRASGYTAKDIKVCIYVLSSQCDGDRTQWEPIARDLLGNSAVARFNEKANRSRNAQTTRDANYRRSRIAAGEDERDVGDATRRQSRDAQARMIERMTSERTRDGDPKRTDR